MQSQKEEDRGLFDFKKKKQMIEFIRDKEFQIMMSSHLNKSPLSMLDSSDYNRSNQNKAVALQNQLINQKIQEYDLTSRSPKMMREVDSDMMKLSVISSRRATHINNNYQNNVFLKGDLSELSMLNPVFQNNGTMKFNKKFTNLRYQQLEDSLLKQIN